MSLLIPEQGFEKLEAGLDALSETAEPELVEAMRGHVHAAREYLQTEQLPLAQHELSRFLSHVQRSVPLYVSVADAFTLVDVLFREVRSANETPDVMFEDAYTFSRHLYDVADVVTSLPIPPPAEDVSPTQEKLRKEISSFGLESEDEEYLISLVYEIGKLAMEPFTNKEEDYSRRVEIMTEFSSAILNLEGTYLTHTQMASVLGTTILAAPVAAICAIPLTWVVQAVILLGGAAVIIGGAIIILGGPNGKTTKAVMDRLWATIKDGTKTMKDIEDAAKEVKKEATPEEREKLKKALRDNQRGAPNETKRRIQRALDTLG
ncbi:MAG: hypothetical protein ETSY1_44055 [Candidatus Entotheonella factor]|uniref:Uncharacterized protein n=1 Tax=Entotheonella factor TaxID=1429438 RepID=W4L4W2_ENTF1|nr:MAG: hypothetical protein ETSY1_44055 [Candidatus Entotheonella factor]